MTMQRIVTSVLSSPSFRRAWSSSAAQSGGTPPVSTARAANAARSCRAVERGWQFPNCAALRGGSGVHGQAGCATGTCHSLHDELRREQDLSNCTGRAWRRQGGARGDTAASSCRAAATSDVSTPGRCLRSRRIRVQYPRPVHRGAGRTVVRSRRPTGGSRWPASPVHARDARQPDHEKRIPPIVAVFLPPGPGGSAPSSATRSPIGARTSSNPKCCRALRASIRWHSRRIPRDGQRSA